MGRDIATSCRGYPHLLNGSVVLAIVPIMLLVACGGDDDGATTTTVTTAPASSEPTGTPPCSESRHSVVIDFAGFLTDGDQTTMWAEWLDQESPTEPTVRPGVVELTQGYLRRGYEIIYVTTAPAGITVGGLPVPEAARGWIQSNGLAWDDNRTRVIGYNGTEGQGNDAVLSITTELVRLHAEGVDHSAGYTENADKAHAMTTGGVPVQRLYMIGPEAGSEQTMPIANDDVAAHVVQVVEPLPPVCTTG